LRIGDLLLTRGGQLVAVEGVADSGEVTTVYNWRIADYHTYFVSATDDGASVWAHNAYQINDKKYRDGYDRIFGNKGGVDPRSLNIHGSMQPELFAGTVQGMRQQLSNLHTAEAFWRQSVARDGPITIYEISGQRFLFNGNHRFQAALAEGVPIPEWAIRIEQRPNYSGPLFGLDQMIWLPGNK
jgi:hypothetical protein